MSKIKEAALEITTTTTLPAKPMANPWLAVAREDGGTGGVGKLIKFVKGRWQVGDDVVREGSEYVAHIDQLVRGWVKFEGGKVAERIVGKVADGFQPQPRSRLGDTDPKNWAEKDADGRPRDPWTLQWFLPLVGVVTGDLLTFVTSSKGGGMAIKELCEIYGSKDRDGLLPIIALKVRSYKHPSYGRIETPDFAIIGWDGLPAPAVKLSAQEKSAVIDAEMDDEIPF
jgi:hypothetical protein